MQNSKWTDTDTARFFAGAQNDGGDEDGVIEDPDASDDDAASSNIKLYLNGVLKNSENQDGKVDGNAAMNIGGRGGLTGTSTPTLDFFGGRVDELRVSGTALDVAALWSAGAYSRELLPDSDTLGLWHFNEGAGTTVEDSSGNGKDGTLGSSSAAPTWHESVQWSNAFIYDEAGNRTGWTTFDGSTKLSYTYAYNTLNQLGSRTSGSLVTSYLYGANGNRIEKEDKVSGSVMATWEYDWNRDDRLVEVRVKNSVGTVTKSVEYQYCRTCGGQRTGRVEYDENDEVVEWLRYEMDGLNHLRIDEVYDADSNGELEDPSAGSLSCKQ